MTKKPLKLFSKPIFKFKEIDYTFLKFWRWNWQKIKEGLKICLLTLCVVLAFMLIYYTIAEDSAGTDEELAGSISDKVISYLDENNMTGNGSSSSEDCNVVGINLHGSLYNYISDDTTNDKGDSVEDQVASENIVSVINEAEKNDKIKAIILEIDSPGGLPVAAEEVANAMKRAQKPTAAYIRTQGVSAAYWSSTGADIIFASAVSDVGGIGVTSSYVDNAKKNAKDGLTYNSLSTGRFKDLGNLDKPLTAEEKALVMRDINIVNENFIKTVATNRNLDIEKVRQIADGATMTGQAALENGLIDRIGGFYEANDYVKEKIGEEPNICWY